MRILKFCLVISALLSALFFSGCATVTRGRTEQLTVLSEPAGASVRLSNGNTGVTPVTFTVRRKGDIYVTVFKDGYETVGLVVYAQLSSNGTVGFLGNALIGGVIGGGVDVYTGATLSHVPNPVSVRLVPKVAPAPTAAASANTPVPASAPNEPAKPAAAPAAVQASAAPPSPSDPVPAAPPSEPAKSPVTDSAAAAPPAAPAPVEPPKPPAPDSPAPWIS